MPETPTFGRYAEIPYDQMTPQQQEGYRSLVETRGRLPGPNKSYVHNPRLVKVMGPLGAYFRTGYSLSEREREIAVIIVNSKWHSAYPTNAHERAGKAAGLPADKVEAMLSGLPTSFDDKREQVIYEMAKCLTESRWVSKGLYDRAVEALGHEGITDVICLMGFYTSVSMTLAFYDVPAGAEGLQRYGKRGKAMLIVDAQVHIWSAGPPTNPSHRQVNSYTAEECIHDMDAAGVNACLLHPPGWDPNSGKISEEAAA